MAVDALLLALVRCPETRQLLAPAPAALLARVESERWPTRAGAPPAARVEEALLREDGRLLFPVRNGIPILLLEESIPVVSVT